MVGECSVHPMVQRLFKGVMRLCGRYQLASRAEHCTETSVVRLATDLEGKAVAIKFMKNRQQLELEVESRTSLLGSEEDSAVVAVLAHTNDESLGSDKFAAEAQKLGYGNLPHGIVMEAMDRNLAVATLQESLSPDKVSDIMRAVVQCVNQLHQRAGVIHGDLKQANIMRTMDGRRWKLIDLDCSCVIGKKVNTRASMAYCAPELARHILMPNKVPCPAAHPSLDVWSIGVMLFELLSRHVLFPRNSRTDDIENISAEQRLCMWLCPTPAMLQQVLGQTGSVDVRGDQSRASVPGREGIQLGKQKSAPTLPSPRRGSVKQLHRPMPGSVRKAVRRSRIRRFPRVAKSPRATCGAMFLGRQAVTNGIFPGADVNDDTSKHATNLVQWCLQGDPKDRPSLGQVLSHPFLNWRRARWDHGQKHSKVKITPLKELTQRTHAFISHFQIEAAGEASRIFKALEDVGATGWLDMHADDLTAEGMRAGVENADVFLLLLTSNVLTRHFCLKEFAWALAKKKPIMILVEEEERFFPWRFEEWMQNKVWDKTNRQWVPATPVPMATNTWKKFISQDDGSAAWLNTVTGKWQTSDPSNQPTTGGLSGQAGTYNKMGETLETKLIRDKV